MVLCRVTEYGDKSLFMYIYSTMYIDISYIHSGYVIIWLIGPIPADSFSKSTDQSLELFLTGSCDSPALVEYSNWVV